MHFLLLAMLCGLGGAPDAESRRLPDDKLRSELQRRGLTDLLEYHLRTRPPDDDVAANLLQRDLRLRQYADGTLPVAQRLEAARQASEILRRLIRERPDDDRNLEWQLSLGRDLIDRHAEPYCNNIMFRRGSAEDQRQLALITKEALGIYDGLQAAIQEQLDAVDHMPAREFERLARSGQFERLEELLPRVRYCRMWAAYYNCLALPPDSPGRRESLQGIMDYLTSESRLVEIPHNVSHYQAQSLLLAGMAQRLAGETHKAETMLSEAGLVVDGISDEAERSRLRWVITLAALERVRGFRDAGDYDRALQVVASYRQRLAAEGDPEFGLRLALALLEGTVHTARLQSLPAGLKREREELKLAARQPLLELVRDHPEARSEVYRMVFDQLGESAGPQDLDPFEKSVYVARTLEQAVETRAKLREAEQAGRQDDVRRLSARQSELLASAVSAGRALLDDGSPLALQLRPEARFNLAVCYQEQGRTLEAVEQLNRIVADHADFERLELAAGYAVRLAEQVYSEAPAAQRAAMRPALLAALRNMSMRFPEHPKGGDMRFTQASVLQEDRQLAAAAGLYASLPAGHPRRAEALLRAAQCHLQLLRDAAAGQSSGDAAALARETRTAVDQFRQAVRQQEPAAPQMGEAQLIECEAELLDSLGKPARVLACLEEFDTKFSTEQPLAGRAIRLRILGYQAAGESERAAAIIPLYVRSDPRGAGPTLQGLLQTLNEDIDRLETAGRSDLARQRTADALAVARELVRWAEDSPEGASVQVRLSVQLALGEALLRSAQREDLTEALELFEAALRAGPGKEAQARASWGRAEALYLLGRHAEALTHFSDIYRALPEDSAGWWQALLRELQCRRALDQDPQMLYNVIEQKKTLFPALGGPAMKRQFQKLQAELQ
jgi:tetratricopeptide (TPR) repeat protein